MWEFLKIRGTLFGSYYLGYLIWGVLIIRILLFRVPYFRKPPCRVQGLGFRVGKVHSVAKWILGWRY